MKLKMKLTSTVAAFLLILGLTIMGVFAMPTVNVTLKGKLTFNATNVSATVKGAIANTKSDPQPTLPDLTYKADYQGTEETDLETNEGKWGNCPLVFKDDGSAIVITITIINNAVDRPLYASVNKDLTCSFDNVKTTMTNKARNGSETDSEYKGQEITIPADKDDNLNFVNIEISIEVDNKNQSISKDADYGFNIELDNQEQEKLQYTYDTVDGKNVASVSMVSREVTRGAIVVPETVTHPETKETYTVTSVADFGFSDQQVFNETFGSTDYEAMEQAGSLITSIQLPDTITRIGFDAFGANTQLESINIPASVTEIGDLAFGLTYSLKSIEMVNMPQITNITEEIGFPLVFLGSGIESVKIDNGEIPMGMFICIPDFGFESKIKTVELGEGVTGIGMGAFAYCTNLEEIDLGGVTSIEQTAFGGCTSLKTIDLKNVEEIGEVAFAATGLTEIKIVESVSTIGEGAFDECTNLKKVIIDSEAIASRDTSVTDNMLDNATEVYIKASIFDGDFTLGSYFGNLVLADNEVTIDGVQYKKLGVPVTSEERDGLKYDYTSSNKTAVVSAGTSTSGAVVIPETVTSSDGIEYSVTSVKASGFANNTNITAITIPASVTTIGSSAFSECTGLKTLIIESIPATYGATPFSGCTSLENVTINSGDIPSQMFKDFTSINTLTIGEGVTSIGTSAFSGCSSIKNVTVDDISLINASTLSNTGIINATLTVNSGEIVTSSDSEYISRSFDNLIVGPNVTKVSIKGIFYNLYFWSVIVVPENDTFYSVNNCVIDKKTKTLVASGSVDDLTIPQEVTSIGMGAFFRSGLKSINLSNVTSIGDYAFQECSKLTTIDLSNCTSIGTNAFSQCSELTEITLGTGITSISNNVFSGCNKIATINYLGTKEQWATLLANIGDNNGTLKSAKVTCSDGVYGE